MSHILKTEKIRELVHFPYSSCFVPPTETAHCLSHAPYRNGAPELLTSVENVRRKRVTMIESYCVGMCVVVFLFLFFRLY